MLQEYFVTLLACILIILPVIFSTVKFIRLTISQWANTFLAAHFHEASFPFFVHCHFDISETDVQSVDTFTSLPRLLSDLFRAILIAVDNGPSYSKSGDHLLWVISDFNFH